MISIVTPVYNAELYLKTCLESVLEQDCPDWEWILVDDGSIDNSREILTDYSSKDDRIRVLSQQNGGPAMARNHALDFIRGEYVTFLDADDWMEPGTLTRIQKICEKEKPDLILWNYKRFQNGEYVQSRNPLPPAGMIPEEELRKYELDLIFRLGSQMPQYAPFIWVRAVKVSLLTENNIRFHTDLRRSEDTLFSITVQRYCRTMYILADQPCVVYRMNDMSVTHSYVKNYMQGMDQIYEDIISWAERRNDQEMKLRAHYMYIYRTLFAIREEVIYKDFIKAVHAVKDIMKSLYLRESLETVGINGTKTFGRRYAFLYRKQAFFLSLLLKVRN